LFSRDIAFRFFINFSIASSLELLA
jgi:hypothetical protein